MNFNKQIDSLKAQINGLLHSDTPKEVIDQIKGITDGLEGVKQEHAKTETELVEMKDLYISVVKNTGTEDKPEEPTHEDKPKSLQEIALEMTSKK